MFAGEEERIDGWFARSWDWVTDDQWFGEADWSINEKRHDALPFGGTR
jgi:hypothetical protein